MIRLLTGDCRDMLAALPANSVHCVVTSPPYYGLRDYGTAQWDGGDADCQHIQASRRTGSATTLRSDGREHTGPYDGEKALVTPMPFRSICGKCGARRIDRQLGLEATPEAYLATMVQVFREVRRVLRLDGTCWVNMGDSYASSGPRGHGGWDGNNKNPDGTPRLSRQAGDQWGGATAICGYKPKDLLLMPARLALALQADGWWLRSDIIWAKPNPMPESCRDRPTSAHEHVFLLTKRSRYFYDADAVREEAEYGRSDGACQWNRARESDPRDKRLNTGGAVVPGNGGTRNLRNVWTIATAPFPAAHFATFPPELAERCIRAGTSEKGACPQCGAPWYRVTDKSYTAPRGNSVIGAAKGLDKSNGWSGYPVLNAQTATIGWHPTCACDKPGPVVPCTVLDPFSGAGTSGLVADRLGRDAIMIDLSHAYVEMARERLTQDCPLFADINDAPVPSDDAYDRGMRDLFAEAAE